MLLLECAKIRFWAIRKQYETNHHLLIAEMQTGKKRFATITAYDYSFAKLFAEEGINVMLVGDSLGMTVQGHDSTLPVTVEDIAYHTRAVRRVPPPACCFPICRLWRMPPRNRPSKMQRQ